MNPKCDRDSIESLQSRTKSTLKGEDPVIQLLDNRMRDVFRMLVMNPLNETPQQVPTSLKTGRNFNSFLNGRRRQGRQQQQPVPTSTSALKSNDTFDSIFKKRAKQEFIKKGFAFYSNELAEASLLASRTINLVLGIHFQVIEKLFVEACRE